MKNLTLLVICFLSFNTLMFSQLLNTTQYKKEPKVIIQVSLGLNAVDNTGNRFPVSNPGDWAFGTPVSIGIEARRNYTSALALALDLGYNDYDSLHYYSVDGSFKYYLNEWIKSEKFELAPMAGAGVFNINKNNVSLNFGGSVAYWFNDKLAVRIKSLSKFALNNSESYTINNNHFMHHLELVYAL